MENKSTFIDEFSIRMSPFERAQIDLSVLMDGLNAPNWYEFARELGIISERYPARKNCSGSAFWELKDHRLTIKNVIFNDPATIVIWHDGTKTVVKCQPGDTFDKEKGLALCIVKKCFGNTSRGLNDILHRWCD